MEGLGYTLGSGGAGDGKIVVAMESGQPGLIYWETKGYDSSCNLFGGGWAKRVQHLMCRNN